MSAKITYLCSFILGILVKLVGGWDMPLETLVIFLCIDYITGVAVGYKKKELSSEKGFTGIFKKFAILFVVILATRIDLLLATDYIRNAVCMVYVVNETLSIIENLGAIGVPIPEQIKEAVNLLKSRGGK